MHVLVTRRAILAALALTRAPPRQASATGEVQARAEYFGTRSGLLYFDKPIFFGAAGFEDVPCRGSCLDRTWAPPDPDELNISPAKVLRGDGDEVRIEYRVRRGFFDGEIVALSDGIGNGGAVMFKCGDGTVNSAIDELVRTLPSGVVRRAIVPEKFDLDRGTRPEYPRPTPPGITYVEMALRKVSASGSLGVCPGGDERYNTVASCICGSGEATVGAFDGYQPGGFAG